MQGLARRRLERERTGALLSGGLDSGSILAAMLETGLDFGICSFRFGGHPSDDEINATARWQQLCPQIRSR